MSPAAHPRGGPERRLSASPAQIVLALLILATTAVVVVVALGRVGL